MKKLKRPSTRDVTYIYCVICDKKTTSEEDLTQHVIKEHVNPQDPYKCTKCRMAFILEETLVKHDYYNHNGPKPNEFAFDIF